MSSDDLFVLLDVSLMITDIPSCVVAICCCRGFSSICLVNDKLSFFGLVFFFHLSWQYLSMSLFDMILSAISSCKQFLISSQTLSGFDTTLSNAFPSLVISSLRFMSRFLNSCFTSFIVVSGSGLLSSLKDNPPRPRQYSYYHSPHCGQVLILS